MGGSGYIHFSEGALQVYPPIPGSPRIRDAPPHFIDTESSLCTIINPSSLISCACEGIIHDGEPQLNRTMMFLVNTTPAAITQPMSPIKSRTNRTGNALVA